MKNQYKWVINKELAYLKASTAMLNRLEELNLKDKDFKADMISDYAKLLVVVRTKEIQRIKKSILYFHLAFICCAIGVYITDDTIYSFIGGIALLSLGFVSVCILFKLCMLIRVYYLKIIYGKYIKE